MKKALIAVVCLTCTSMPAIATDMFIEAGIHLGGDTLATASSGNYDEKLKAGQLLSLAVGIHTELGEAVQGRLSLGYKFDSVSADNGDATFDRFPIEALVMKRSGSFMFGGGLAYHLSPEYEFNVSPSFTIEFDDAVGLVLAFDYNSKGEFADDWFVGGRITLIDYEAQGITVDGNSIGAVIGFMFE